MVDGMIITEIKLEPDPEIIEYLEDLLEYARSGELQAIAMVRYYNDSLTSNGWAGVKSRSIKVKLLGELEVMKSELLIDIALSSVEDI